MAPCPGVGESTTASYTAGTGTKPPGTAPPSLNLPRDRQQAEGEGWEATETEEHQLKLTPPPQAALPTCTPLPAAGVPGRNKLSRVLRHPPCTPRQPGPPPKPPSPLCSSLPCSQHAHPPAPARTGPVCAHTGAQPQRDVQAHAPHVPPAGVTAPSAQRPTPCSCATLAHTVLAASTPLHAGFLALWDPLFSAGQPCQAVVAVTVPGRLHKQAARRTRSRAHARLAHTHKPHGLTPVLAGARAPLQEEALASRCLFPPLTPSLDLDPARGPAAPTALCPQPRQEDGDEDEGSLALAAPRAGSGHLPRAWGQMLRMGHSTDVTHWGLAPMQSRHGHQQDSVSRQPQGEGHGKAAQAGLEEPGWSRAIKAEAGETPGPWHHPGTGCGAQALRVQLNQQHSPSPAPAVLGVQKFGYAALEGG